jgi:hypothetical protein
LAVGRLVLGATWPNSAHFSIKGALGHCTALWCCYVGTWEIVGGRRYLSGLDGSFVGRDDLWVPSFFPEHPERVLADWYTGTLSLLQGEVIDANPMGPTSTSES